MKKTIELLAPAKDKECGIAAIKCGADAVYIGAPSFGARYSAGNSLEDIKELISFAHKFRAKVYIAFNILIKDAEISEALSLINKLYEIGADALIIQDMGLLELDLPPIPLFASTQSHNTSAEKVEFLEKVGFQRVILARELSIEQIKEIKSKTTVELESFVHGSLCVSYSGKCYLSLAIGGRSGNRGHCAQPCRKQYSLTDKSGNVISESKHLLCLKDLNLSEHLEEMLAAGVTSFKIEGRLKDISYVKNIVSYYRQKLDEVLDDKIYERSSVGTSSVDFEPDPLKTFNRGYTEYFINGERDKITQFDTPKSTGEPIGNVLEVDKDSFRLNSEGILHNGDGICFFDKNDELKGTVVNRVDKSWVYPQSMEFIEKKSLIYRNSDHEFLKLLQKAKIERKIPVSIEVSEENGNIIFKIADPEGTSAVLTGKNVFEIALNADKALDTIKKQLSKLGDTDFSTEEVIINLENQYFIPVKELNAIRRELVEKLELERESAYKRQEFQIEKNDFPYVDKELLFNANVLNQKAADFYSRHGAVVFENTAENMLNMNNKAVMTAKHCLKYEFGLCPKKQGDDKMPEQLYLVDDYGKKYLLKFNCLACEMEVIF